MREPVDAVAERCRPQYTNSFTGASPRATATGVQRLAVGARPFRADFRSGVNAQGGAVNFLRRAERAQHHRRIEGAAPAHP